MPRIDPSSLLKCLSILLSPNGGIKSTDEVNRIANLMTKFSKKLVSKCIYIQILKNTDVDLLMQFMASGGWGLIHNWLTDAIVAKNWALIEELLQLFLLCPVDIERLKSNNCPKLIKGLSKDGNHHEVRNLATKIVDHWLRIVKGEAESNTLPPPPTTMAMTLQASTHPEIEVETMKKLKEEPVEEQIVGIQSLEIKQEVEAEKMEVDNGTEVPESSAKIATKMANSDDKKNLLMQVETNTEKVIIKEVLKPVAEEEKVEEVKMAIDVNEVVEKKVVEGEKKESENSVDKENKKKDDKSNKKDEKSSSSSSKHKSSSSSSSKHSSHKSSSHKSSRSSRDNKSSSRDKDKDKHSSSRSKSRSDRDKEREKEKDKLKKEQADKDKSTLEKVQGQSLSSKLGKIPKKRPTEPDDKEKKKELMEKKNISISIGSRKNSTDAPRPKTVKTFNSKFRSTGLEEEIKPPNSRIPPKKPEKLVPEKKILLRKASPPLRDVVPIAEKKMKLALESPPLEEKKGAIKLIKPKPMVLQESDMFMDALTASMKSKDSRKKKRKVTPSKEEAKKVESKDASPPPASPLRNSDDKASSQLVKPELKFYQDTLLENEAEPEEKMKLRSSDKKNKNEDDRKDNEENSSSMEEDGEDAKAESPTEVAEVEKSVDSASTNGGLKSVLLLQKRKGPKKTLKWKSELESIRYFELDETERVNVTKTFGDMRLMDKQNEGYIMARKLCNVDVMEEKTRWRVLIPIDLPLQLVIPGCNSTEKEIQYDREKGILQALYPSRCMIPDSATEPDPEPEVDSPHTPLNIPLDDLTGNKDSEKDYSSHPWPEPKVQAPPPPPSVPGPFTHFHHQGIYATGPVAPPPPVPIVPMVPNADPSGGASGWRTADGKVVMPDGMNPMNPGGFVPPMEGMMPPPGMMGPPMYNEAYGAYMGPPPPPPPSHPSHEEMAYSYPPPPPMYAPGPSFQGPRMPPPPPSGRGRGGPWFGPRGGGPPRGAAWRPPWRPTGKQPPLCRQFKNGYCKAGDKCAFFHPTYPQF